jgi:YgiT-type zinc finger domain-containing protein
MTGADAKSRPCPLCRGELARGVATVPFVVGGAVIVIRDVPAEVCGDCGEPFLDAAAADQALRIMGEVKGVATDVVVARFPPHDTRAA